MGWLKRPIRKDLCCLAIEFIPDLSGSGSGHGSSRPHRLHPSHNPLPKQHKRVAGSPKRRRVGDGGTSPRRACDQCRRPPPHIVERVVPECAPPGLSEPDPAKAFSCVFMWAPSECGDMSTCEASGPK